MTNLVSAVHSVMEDCKGIEKSMTVGSGSSSYKGVSDKDVKVLVGGSMRKHGLVMFPVSIEPRVQIDRWDTTDYNGKPTTKQSVFTEAIVTYRLMHTSGESIDVVGYGHGIDSQDKGAGKATTYAMKYALLYTFMVATGHIDDADNTHSNDIPVPTSKPAKKSNEPDAAFGEHYHIVKAKLLNEPSNGRKALLARALTSDKVKLTDEEKTALKQML